jgi:hypothetical protein
MVKGNEQNTSIFIQMKSFSYKIRATLKNSSGLLKKSEVHQVQLLKAKPAFAGQAGCIIIP